MARSVYPVLIAALSVALLTGCFDAQESPEVKACKGADDTNCPEGLQCMTYDATPEGCVPPDCAASVFWFCDRDKNGNEIPDLIDLGMVPSENCYGMECETSDDGNDDEGMWTGCDPICFELTGLANAECVADSDCAFGPCVGARCCAPSCDGTTCGDDGCGGTCSCEGSAAVCNPDDNKCSCEPSCDGKTCGDDGCAGSCGDCADGQSCSGGACVEGCTADCADKTCGDDGCGGSCGDCTGDQSCSGGTCVDGGCTPSCGAAVCGDDGCGGSCGDCTDDQSCTDGACVDAGCTPNCGAAVCGDDGCGGSCGDCADGESCDASGACLSASGCTTVTVTGDLSPFAAPNTHIYDAPLAPFGGANNDQFELQFYLDDIGTFDLSSGANNNTGTCNQCVLVYRDTDAGDGTIFFQDSGQIEVLAGSTPSGGTVSVTLTDVTLVEVTMIGFDSTPVPGGDCLSLTSPLTVATP